MPLSPLIPGGAASTPSTTVNDGPLVRAIPSIPAGWESRIPLRIYRQPDVIPLLTNLAANPTRRTTTYADAEIFCLTQEYSTSQLADITTAINLGKALSPRMYVFPAARVAVYADPASYLTGSGGATFTFDKYCDPDYWLEMADNWEERIIPLRSTDDPRIGISTENYAGGGAEPTIDNLADLGFTRTQFERAVTPFLERLKKYACYPYVGPIAGSEVGNFNLWIPLTAEIFGTDRMQSMWEVGGGYGQSENFRKFPHTDYFDDVREIFCGLSVYNGYFGPGVIHRISAGDNMLRQWGETWKTHALPTGSMGDYAPWLEYFTKTDTASAGTDSYYIGTTLNSSNDVQFAWVLGPMIGADMPYSVGSGTSVETSTRLDCVRSANQTSVGVGTGTVDHHAGSRLEPQGSDIYAAWRVRAMPEALLGADPNQWTVYAEFEIPSTLAASRALLSQADTGIGLWQVYYDNGADAIKIEYGDAGSTTATLLSGPARDTTLKLLVSRAGNTQWHATMDGTRVSTTLASTLSNYRFIIFGGGEEVATFHTSNTIESCRHFVGKKLRVWHRALDVTETARQFTHTFPHGIV